MRCATEKGDSSDPRKDANLFTHTPLPAGMGPHASGPLHVRGRILPNDERRDVYVVEGRITFETPKGATTLTDGGWMLPGLVDAHAHLAISSPAGNAPARERVRASARAHLAAGVLLVREPGSPDRASAGIGVAEGLPRVVTAGRFLAPPGGYIPGLAREVTAARLPAAVTEEARASGAWVKLIGDFIGAQRRIVPNWDLEDLRKAAAAAHAAKARITVHAIHPQAITDAVAAGFDAIEHGIGMPEHLLDTLREERVAWVPTLSIDRAVPSFLESATTAEGLSEVKRWVKGHGRTVAAASKAGVTVLAGTDAGMVPHGLVAGEVGLLIDAGMTAEDALAAASWTARAYLGMPGIEEGAPADLVVFDRDPRSGAHALHRPSLTILDGRVVGKPAS